MATNTHGYEEENPIRDVAVTIADERGSLEPGEAGAAERYDALEDVVDRLKASTTIPIEESFDHAKEARKTHRIMAEEAEADDVLTRKEKTVLIDAFDRLVTSWINSPSEIQSEVWEYKRVLETLRED